ncbi:MAG: hypothetical protein ACJ0QU_00710 [Halobacteriales archaeon]
MSADLEIQINRVFPNSIEVEESPIEVSGSFGVILYNNGSPCHVYLQLSDEIAEFAYMGVSNRFLREQENVRLDVRMRENAPETEGWIKIVTGHGSETAYATIRIKDSKEIRTQVIVDEKLAIPKPKVVNKDSVMLTGKLPLVALMMIAITMAATSLAIIQNWIIIIGVAVIIAGMYIAYQLIRT